VFFELADHLMLAARQFRQQLVYFDECFGYFLAFGRPQGDEWAFGEEACRLGRRRHHGCFLFGCVVRRAMWV
jgi:hypothetical protein